MKLIALILISVFQISYTADHDAVIAIFNLSQEERNLSLEIGFDIEDYLATHQLTKEQVTTSQVSGYINDKISWIINDIATTMEVVNVSEEDEHFRVKCELKLSVDKIDKLKIHNEFFMNVEGHSNIIRLDINDSRKDYRMHADRKMIEVLY